jgi:hypothetical protein
MKASLAMDSMPELDTRAQPAMPAGRDHHPVPGIDDEKKRVTLGAVSTADFLAGRLWRR